MWSVEYQRTTPSDAGSDSWFVTDLDEALAWCAHIVQRGGVAIAIREDDRLVMDAEQIRRTLDQIGNDLTKD